MKVIVVKINGKDIALNKGTYLIEALKVAGVDTDKVTHLDLNNEIYYGDEISRYGFYKDEVYDGDVIITRQEKSSMFKEHKATPVLKSCAPPSTEVPSQYSTASCTVSGCTAANKNNNNKKGGFNMNMKTIFGGNVGKVEDRRFAMSFKGIAIMDNTDKYQAYDKEAGTLTDVTDLLISDSTEFLFAMPKAKAEAGDLVMKDNTPYYVTDILVNGGLAVVNPLAGKSEVLVPKKNIFGFNFVIVIQSLLNFDATDDQPFGNMLPLLLMKDGGLGGGDSLSTLLMMQAFGGGTGDMNSMLPLLLMKDGGLGGKDDMLSTLLMAQAFGGNSDIFGDIFGGAKKTKAAPKEETYPTSESDEGTAE